MNRDDERSLRGLWSEILLHARAGRASLGELVGDRLGDLVAARHETPAMSEQTIALSVSRLVAEANRLGSSRTTSDLPEVKNGRVRAHSLSNLPRRSPWRMVWVGAAAAVALMVGLVLWSRFSHDTSRQDFVAHPGAPVSPDKRAPEKPAPRAHERVVQDVAPKKEPGRVAERVAVRELQVGRLGAVIGTPFLVGPNDAKPRNGYPGMAVALGSRIETGDMDKAVLEFTDGTTISLDFNTAIVIPRSLDLNNDRSQTSRQDLLRPDSIALKSGHLFARVTHLPNGAHFRIVTPAATAEVLGTEFGLQLQKMNSAYKATLQVKQGRVAFYNGIGPGVTATDQTETSATDSTKPTDPKRVEILKVSELSPGHRWVTSTWKLSIVEGMKRFAVVTGVDGLDLWPQEHGEALVVRARLGYPATVAGIRQKDVVVAINGVPVKSVDQYKAAIALRPNERVSVTVLRDGASHTFAFRTLAFNGFLRGMGSKPLVETTSLAIQGRLDEALARLSPLARSGTDPAAANALGVVQEMRDEMGPAIRAFQRAVRLNPDQSLYHLNLGLALIKIGNIARGTEELAVAHSLRPDWLTGTSEYINALSLADRHDEALRVADEAILATPDDPSLASHWVATLLYRKSRELAHLGRIQSAKTAIQQMFTVEPNSVYGWSVLAEIQHDALENEAAAESHRRCLAINPMDAPEWHKLGVLRYEAGDLVEAERALRRAVALDPRDRGAVSFLIYTLKDNGRLPEAFAVAQRAIATFAEKAQFYADLAVLYKAQGLDKEVEEACRKAIACDPTFFRAYDILAGARFRQRRFAEAEALVRRAVALSPQNGPLRGELGLLLCDLGKYAEAEVELRESIRLDPRNSAAFFNLARLLRLTGRDSESVEFYRKASALSPRNTQMLNDLAAQVQKLGNDQEAEELWRRCLAVDPEYPFALLGLGYLRMDQGDSNEAERLFQRAIQAEPRNFGAHDGLGRLMLRAGRLDLAEKHLTIACEVRPTDPYPLNALASVVRRLGRLDDAVGLYRKAIALKPAITENFGGLAALLGEMGKAEEAAQVLRQGLEAFPGHPVLLISLAEALVTSGKLQEAKDAYAKALQADPKARDAWIRLGKLVCGLGQLRESEAAFRKALELEPNDADTLDWLVDVLLRQGEHLDEALSLGQRAMKLAPTDMASVCNVGWAYFMLKDLPNAEQHLAKALVGTELGRQPDCAGMWAILGVVYERTNRKEKAVEAYKTALKLDPKDPEAVAGMKRLGG